MKLKKANFKYTVILLSISIILLLVFQIYTQNPQKMLCSGKPCNVILIVIDTLGAKHLGIYGYHRPTSPFIDSFFSKNSLVFKNAISNATWTNPSFASFLTSQYASEIPVATWEDKIPEDMPNFVAILKKANVDVGLISPITYSGKGIPADQSVFRKNERTITEQNLLFFSASEWLINQQTKNNPFFLMIHNFTVHHPYDPPIKYRTLFTEKGLNSSAIEAEIASKNDFLQEASATGKAIKQYVDRLKLPYDQEISYVDDQLKDFIGSLPKEMLDTSIVILTADHGEAFWEHSFLSHNNKPYQELIHIPFLIRMPSQTNRIIELNVSLLDLAPTILDIYGLNSPKEFRGTSLWQLITNDKNQARIVKSEYFKLKAGDQNQKSSKEQSEVYLIEHSDSTIESTIEAGILNNWKLINENTNPQLYDLKSDPEEKNNLINKLDNINSDDKKTIHSLFENFGITQNIN